MVDSAGPRVAAAQGRRIGGAGLGRGEAGGVSAAPTPFLRPYPGGVSAAPRVLDGLARRRSGAEAPRGRRGGAGSDAQRTCMGRAQRMCRRLPRTAATARRRRGQLLRYGPRTRWRRHRLRVGCARDTEATRTRGDSDSGARDSGGLFRQVSSGAGCPTATAPSPLQTKAGLLAGVGRARRIRPPPPPQSRRKASVTSDTRQLARGVCGVCVQDQRKLGA